MKPFLFFILILVGTCGSLAACGFAPGTQVQDQGGWQGTTVRNGDTLLVRTTEGSVWINDGWLVEEVAFGTETEEEEAFLGDIVALDAAGGQIYLADRIFTTVQVYDMDGNHIKNIGREGEGPGEFRSITDLGIDPVREELVVRESSGVLHRLTLGGEYLERSTRVGQGSVSGDALFLRVTRDGESMVFQMYVVVDRSKDPPITASHAFFTLDSMGVFADTLDVSWRSDDEWVLRVYQTHANGRDRSFKPVPVPFGPVEVRTISMGGEYIGGRPSEYRFEIRHRDGGRTVIEKDCEAIPVDPGEKGAAERRVYGIMKGFNPGWAWEGPSIPDTKPFYTAIVPDRSGRLWVLREGEGHAVEGWTEPDGWRAWEDYPEWVPERWFEVFEEETGRYLGRVDVPTDFQVEPEPYIEGNTVIARTEDGMGRHIVKRYRLEVPLPEAASRAGASSG